MNREFYAMSRRIFANKQTTRKKASSIWKPFIYYLKIELYLFSTTHRRHHRHPN